MRRGWAGLNGVKTRSGEGGRKRRWDPPPKPHLLPKVALAIPSSCVSHESFAAPPMSSLSSSSFFFFVIALCKWPRAVRGGGRHHAQQSR